MMVIWFMAAWQVVKLFACKCNGDVEPCVFVHFAADNIKEKA